VRNYFDDNKVFMKHRAIFNLSRKLLYLSNRK